MPAERILVTDDEDAIREIVSSMLTSANFVCSQASSGKEALALLQSGEEYELMLSDLMMPGMDGEALLATVRRALENRRLKLENRAYQTNLEALVTARTEQLRNAVRELEESYDISLELLGDALGLND